MKVKKYDLGIRISNHGMLYSYSSSDGKYKRNVVLQLNPSPLI
jgi:hypothetical protein